MRADCRLSLLLVCSHCIQGRSAYKYTLYPYIAPTYISAQENSTISPAIVCNQEKRNAAKIQLNSAYNFHIFLHDFCRFFSIITHDIFARFSRLLFPFPFFINSVKISIEKNQHSSSSSSSACHNLFDVCHAPIASCPCPFDCCIFNQVIDFNLALIALECVVASCCTCCMPQLAATFGICLIKIMENHGKIIGKS